MFVRPELVAGVFVACVEAEANFRSDKKSGHIDDKCNVRQKLPTTSELVCQAK